MESSITYNLSQKLQYSVKGEFEDTASIELLAPSYETMSHALKLSQFLMRAIMAQANSLKGDNTPEGAEDADIDSKAINTLLLASDISMAEVVSSFQELAYKIGYLDSDKRVRLKEAHFAKMKISDIIQMTCEYMAAFSVPSV